MKIFTAPQHIRSILPPIHPTKSSLRCVGGIFLLRELHIENFMSRPDVIPTFCQRRCKTGVGTSFGANGDQHTRAAEPSTYFCVLTIRKQLPRNGFERSGRGQEPSRGHKFSILENFLSIRDFTSAMRPHFRSDLVGACLPQTLLRTDEEELCQFDAIPPTYREKQSVPDCWVSVKQFSKNDTATACQDWLRSTRLGRGSIKSHVRTVKVLGMGLFAFQERVHLWKGVTH